MTDERTRPQAPQKGTADRDEHGELRGAAWDRMVRALARVIAELEAKEPIRDPARRMDR